MCNFYLAGFSLAQRHFYVHSTKELIMRRVVKKFNIPFREISRVFEPLKIGSFKFTFRLDFHPTLASLNYFLLGHRRQSNARGLFGRKTSFDEDSITDQSSSRLLIPNNSRRWLRRLQMCWLVQPFWNSSFYIRINNEMKAYHISVETLKHKQQFEFGSTRHGCY